MENMPDSGQDSAYLGLRQGHAFAAGQLGLEGDSTYVLVSQTCDIVLRKRPTIIVALVCELDGKELDLAQGRDNPRFVGLPGLGPSMFADLGYLTTIPKDSTEPSSPTAAIDLDDDVSRREFALAVGRWFSRFAFPDEVVPWLRPLLEVIHQRHDKPESPLGKMLQSVVEFRVEAQNWGARPLDLTLHVIVFAGSVPSLDEPANNPVLQARLRASNGTPKAPGEIAVIAAGLTEPADVALAWETLVDAFGAMCKPRGRDDTEEIRAAVSSIVGSLSSDDEFPLSSVRRSECLDLDHLSMPTPLGGSPTVDAQ